MSKHRHIPRKAHPGTPAVQAAAVTAVVTAAVLGIFSYRMIAPEAKQQYTVLSYIPADSNDHFYYQLELRDPAKMFGSSGGSFSALYTGRDIRLQTRITPPAIPAADTGNGGKFMPLPEIPYPASARFAVPVSPDAANVKSPRTVKVIAPDGTVYRFAELEKIPVKLAVPGTTVVRLSGKLALRRGEILQSCGDAGSDAGALEVLRKNPALTGVYSIVWSRNNGGGDRE